MAEALRERRIRNEAEMLRDLARVNAGRLDVIETLSDRFRVRLVTAAWLSDGPAEKALALDVVFAPYYPAVPIEVYLHEAGIRHANVHPESGFICLWDRHSPGDTVIEALRQTQRVLSGELRNPSGDHLMQPEALALPALPYVPLTLPDGYLLEREARRFPQPRRKRLE
jgi:hypothetical protein